MKYKISYAYTPDDTVDEVYRIYTKAIQDLSLYKENPGLEQDIKDNIKLFLPEQTLEDRCMFLARDPDNSIVGFIAGISTTDFIHPSSKIATEIFLWVDKDHRRSTLAVRLIKAFESWADWAGCTKTSLAFYKHKDEIDLDKLYTRLGYKPLETSYIKNLENE